MAHRWAGRRALDEGLPYLEVAAGTRHQDNGLVTRVAQWLRRGEAATGWRQPAKLSLRCDNL